MSRTLTNPDSTAIPRGFGDDVATVLEEMKAACQDLISAVGAARGGRPIRRAADLQRALDIPSTLAWQVFRVAAAGPTTAGLLSEAGTVPGAKAVRRVIRAAIDKGINGDALEALAGSVERFEHVVRTHAGDRKTFNSIIAGLSEIQTGNASNGESMLNLRRAAFQANSRIWGTQVRTKLSTFVVHPSAGPEDDRLDVLTLFGSIDLCRLHGDAPYELTNTAVADPSPLRTRDRIVALGHPLMEGDVTTPGSTLLAEFTSQPLPKIHNYVDQDGRLVVELDPEDVGRQHAVTAFIAEMYRSSVGRFRTDSEPNFGTSGYTKAPIETWIIDLVIAENAYGDWPPGRRTSARAGGHRVKRLDPHSTPPLTPYAYMVTNLRGKPILLADIPARHDRDIIDRPDVVHLGKGPRVLDTTEVPRYPEMFEHVCGMLGWDARIFHVYRCRVEYPVIPSSIAVGFDLPEK